MARTGLSGTTIIENVAKAIGLPGEAPPPCIDRIRAAIADPASIAPAPQLRRPKRGGADRPAARRHRHARMPARSPSRGCGRAIRALSRHSPQPSPPPG